jgi:translation initiation factor 2B subunit (eIF-2B alpha/beta/delta family)
MDRDDIVLELFRLAATDRRHGAAEIEEALLRGLLASGGDWSRESLLAGARLLAEGQPAMANLRSLATRAAAPGFDEFLERRARVLDELPHRLAANAWPHLEGSNTVVTISRSRTVAAVLEGAWEHGWRGSVVVLDGTATGRGEDQTRRLSGSGEAVSRPDATAPSCLDAAAVVVLVGADAVGPRRFINAAGTTMLMELAAARGLERVLAADSGKDVSEKILDDIVDSLPLHREPPDREWPVFEAIPMNLVSTRITE